MSVLQGNPMQPQLLEAAEVLSAYPPAIRKSPSAFDPKLDWSIVSRLKRRDPKFNRGEAMALARYSAHFDEYLKSYDIVLSDQSVEDLMSYLAGEKPATTISSPAKAVASEKKKVPLKRDRPDNEAARALIELEANPLSVSTFLLDKSQVPDGYGAKPPEWPLRVLDLDKPFGKIKLRKHQKEGVEWALKRGRALIKDVMGLGKTITSLITAMAYDLPIFVITKSKLVTGWVREAAQVGLADRVTVVSNMQLHKWVDKETLPAKGKGKAKQVITPARFLADGPFVLLIDEIHEFGNETAKRTKEAMAIADSPNCVAFYALTGTLMPNGRPIELYPLLHMLRHPLRYRKTWYEQYFCDAKMQKIPIKGTWDPVKKECKYRQVWFNSGARHLDEFYHLFKDWFIARKKNECTDLPPKIRVTRYIEPTDEAKKIYEDKIEQLKHDQIQARADAFEAQGMSPIEAYMKAVESDGDNALVELGRIRQAASLGKVDDAVRIAQEVWRESQEQVILFSFFQETAKAIAKALGCEIIIGGVSDAQERVDRFQSGEHKFISCSFGAGAEGLTMTKGTTVILVDRPWTMAKAEQAEDRAHRIGQESKVTAVWLSAFDVDELIDEIVTSKGERIELALKGKRGTMRGVVTSPQDIAKMVLPVLVGKVKRDKVQVVDS